MKNDFWTFFPTGLCYSSRDINLLKCTNISNWISDHYSLRLELKTLQNLPNYESNFLEMKFKLSKLTEHQQIMAHFHSFVTKLSKHGYNERRQSLVPKGCSNYGIPIALCKPSLPCISKRNIFLIVVHQSKRHRKLTHTHINWPLEYPVPP